MSPIDRLLDAVLRPRLGYGTPPSPARMQARLDELARSLGCDEIGVLERARAGDDAILERLISAATVPHTSFFRHPEQLRDLAAHLRELRPAGQRPVRIWSAGCATGEEVYTLAMTAEEAGVPAEILGTDASAEAIAVARSGWYDARRARGVPGCDLASGWTAPPELRRRLRFERASLIDRSPALGRGPFDVVVCRNVLIYFDREMAVRLLSVLASQTTRDGVVLISPVESLIPPPPELVPSDRAGWLRRASRPARAAPPQRARARKRTAPSVAPPGALEDAALDLARGAIADAEHLLREAVERNPRDGRAWFLLGEALAQRGELNQARAAFEQAILCAEGSRDEEAQTVALAARARKSALT